MFVPPDLADRPPLLLLAWGNPSRGDDALGPRLAEQVEAWAWPDLECLCDFQLQVEHSLDLVGRRAVLLVDAARDPFTEGHPCRLQRLVPASDRPVLSHALSAEAVLQAHAEVWGPPPPAWLLSLRGQVWDLGSPLSRQGEYSLLEGVAQVRHWYLQRQHDPVVAQARP